MSSIRPAHFLALLMLLVPVCVSARAGRCTLKLAQLPRAAELRGFYLGMTADEFRSRAPQVKLARTDKLGSSAVNVFPAFEPKIDAASFIELKTVSLEFLDGKLTSLWIGYDSSFKWQTLDELVTGIGSALKLPVAWTGKSARASEIDCDDFKVTVSMIGQSPSLKMVDKISQRVLDKRRADAEAAESEP